MIYRNTDLARSITWTTEENPEAGDLAKKFLEGERELLQLAHVRSTAIAPINVFLESVVDNHVNVARGIAGELLVQATDSGESLLVTGKTAEVLRAYLEKKPVLTSDRDEMTLRRSAD
jgi:hypothetical protein